jgi:hypothetical protein
MDKASRWFLKENTLRHPLLNFEELYGETNQVGIAVPSFVRRKAVI